MTHIDDIDGGLRAALRQLRRDDRRTLVSAVQKEKRPGLRRAFC